MVGSPWVDGKVDRVGKDLESRAGVDAGSLWAHFENALPDLSIVSWLRFDHHIAKDIRMYI